MLNDRSRTLPFVHFLHADGSCDSMCPVCEVWVASCHSEGPLDQPERAHVCDLLTLPVPSPYIH